MCWRCAVTIQYGDEFKGDLVDGNMWDVLGEEKCVQGLERNPDRRRPLWRPWYRWKESIKVNVTEIGRRVIDWIHLAQVSRLCWTQWWTSMCHKMQRICWFGDELLRLSQVSGPWSLLNKFVTVILMNKQVCVLTITSGTTAATSDGATRDGHHENLMDMSSKWIWPLHAE